MPVRAWQFMRFESTRMSGHGCDRNQAGPIRSRWPVCPPARVRLRKISQSPSFRAEMDRDREPNEGHRGRNSQPHQALDSLGHRVCRNRASIRRSRSWFSCSVGSGWTSISTARPGSPSGARLPARAAGSTRCTGGWRSMQRRDERDLDDEGVRAVRAGRGGDDRRLDGGR